MDLPALRRDHSEKIATLREATADMLDHLANSVPDGRFRSAAAMLRGHLPGRRSTDDAKALEYAESLVKTGMARSIHKACERAAQMYSPAYQVKTMRDRLRKKLRVKLNNYEDTA